MGFSIYLLFSFGYLLALAQDSNANAECPAHLCTVHKCPKYPASKCRIDGGCREVYYTPDGNISPKGCILPEQCPRGSPIQRCFPPPCIDARCPEVPDAICIDSFCRECKAHFYVDGKRIDDRRCFPVPDCRFVMCDSNPCAGARCAAHPRAQCEYDYCSGCIARFTMDGKSYTPEQCKIGMCPGGRPHNCLKNPCDGATCPAISGAECRPNYCDGCKAEFFQRGRKIEDRFCVDLGKCPRDVPQASCKCDREPCQCLGQVCPMVKDAECVIDGCGGCNVVFLQGRKRLTQEDCEGCEPWPPRENCDPCATATCPDHPNARCEARRCRQCKAVFFGADRKEIKRCCNSGKCRDGSHRFHCAKNPCDGATCPTDPWATCKPNYCGGCKAEFYSSFTEMKMRPIDCIEFEECPRNVPVTLCKGPDMCLGETCPMVPGAQCKLDTCNGCRVVFFLGQRRLTTEDCHGCPGNDRVSSCGNPCEGATCPGNPGARCEPRRCGVCRATWFGADRMPIRNCGGSLCKDGSRRYTCAVHPCTVNSCPGVMNAECRPNYCGGCKARFYDRFTGNPLSDFRCTKKEPCPRDMPQAGCAGGKCLDKTCPRVPEAECFIDGCGGCNVIFYKGRMRLTDEDCNGCPRNMPRVANCIDPCRGAVCPLYPNARCEPRKCGECKAVFYSQNREEIKDCCGSGGGMDECPAGVKKHECVVNPCDSASCPAEPLATCKPNYCGGCKAEFFIGSRKLTDMQCVKYPDECAAFTTCLRTECDCPFHSDAQCIVQHCPPNSCKVLYFDKNGNSLSYEDCGLCANGAKHINCGFVPQCRFDECEAHPDAECRSSNCGVCKVWFVDKEGNEVDCKAPTCPDGSRPTPCLVNPCDVETCPGVKNAVCVADNCACKADFYYPESRHKIKDFECVGREECPPGMPLAKCAGDMCDRTPCPMVADADCYIDGCGGCNVVYFKGRKRLTVEDCYGCPASMPKVNCGNQCEDASCPANSKARCEPRVCGKCGVVFYGLDRKEIKSCSPGDGCPPDMPRHACKANPCDVTTCPGDRRAVCRPNYCGGCKAEYFRGSRKLTDIECVENPDRCAAFTSCLVRPCSCSGYPRAQCVTQYCPPNSCKVLYFDGEGNRIPEGACEFPKVTCRVPKLANGRVSPKNRRTIAAGEYITLQCEGGYYLTSRSVKQCINRNGKGRFSGNMPRCIVLVTCEVPPTIKHGERSPSDRSTIALGEKVTYSCHDGYELRGKLSRKCIEKKKNGVLRGGAPKCKDIDECKYYPCNQHATCINTDGSFICKCNVGYAGNGIECNENDPECPEPRGVGTCLSNCQSSGECGYQRICCYNGCSMNCLDRPGLCPNNEPPVQCFANPCQFRKCNRHPTAKCVADYCGGCFAKFYVGNNEVTCY